MTTRHDVSSVPLQGGYVAKQCPVRAQNDALGPAEPIPPSPVLERRFKRGRLFEAEIVADLRRLHPDAIAVEGADSAALEVATAAAIAGAFPLILGGRLPSDATGRRVGKPDLLVAAPGGGYRPVDIKHHMALEPAELRSLPSDCSELARPALENAEMDETARARKHKGDLLQLAHYQRMLEAAGFAAGDGRHGGIIGVERRIVWHDLDAPIWRTPSSSGTQKMRSTMEMYDFEFDFRLDIIAVARQHADDPAVELLVVPVKLAECGGCPWWDFCRPQLEAGSGDVSLVPRIGWREWKILRDHGVTDRAALAALDPRTYAGSGMSSLPEQIDQARAALGPDPVYRRRGIDAIVVPRGDIEVDVDMENAEDGVYLWGALLTDRSAMPASIVHYRPFVTWDPLGPEVQTSNFLEFWNWLMAIRAGAHAAGRTFRAYCYSAAAENTYLRKLGITGQVLDQVEGFIDSDDWVDILRVFDSQLITGGGSGLKMVAPLAGYTWEVDDPGGEGSMLRYEIAVGSSSSEAERLAAREWLLTYNRGDVEATLAIRAWLEGNSRSIAPVESLDP